MGVKLEEGELLEDADPGNTKDSIGKSENGNDTVGQNDVNRFNSHQSGFSRRDGYQRNSKVVNAIHVFFFTLLMNDDYWLEVLYLM